MELIKSISDNQQQTKAIAEACAKIAPLWSLENVVAVNPFMGFADQKFNKTAAYLDKLADIQMAMPVSFYLKKYKEGKIEMEDLVWALSKEFSGLKAEEFLANLEKNSFEKQESAVMTLADLAGKLTGKEWKSFMVSRVSFWASSYFDKGQASWKATSSETGIFKSWKLEAAIDRTAEIQGLKGFRSSIKFLSDDPEEAALQALETLDIPKEFLSQYLYRLLLQAAGWSSYIAQLDWNLELHGESKKQLREFLSILLCWEACLMQALDSDEVNEAWEQYTSGFGRVKETNQQKLSAHLILQEAFNRTAQKQLIQKFRGQPAKHEPLNTQQKLAQAVFCIDVRSETFRRHLEKADPDIETMGFAGFFAFAVNYLPLAQAEGQAQCPALLKPAFTITEKIGNEEQTAAASEKRQLKYEVRQLWKSLKTSAISCFSFVSPLGLTFLVKLLTDTFRLTRTVPDPSRLGYSEHEFRNRKISLNTDEEMGLGISFEQQVETAANALRAMSLTEDFARFVLLVGHGSSSVNNPHASGLDCGACGGHTGEANAKVATAVLNNPKVREALKSKGIEIPKETVFLAGLHDTTTDEVEFEKLENFSSEQKIGFWKIRKAFNRAGQLSRKERAERMDLKGNPDKIFKERSLDWSQVRPEWGLAGCSAFVIAPRQRTQNINFQGRSFLHSYDWKKDQDFKVLELIMTAPMIVTSWISLQYYASVVDNGKLGAGNKTLHNVTGGIGVLEGFSGDLRVGLPQQSVSVGSNVLHEPVKLSVIIEAPLEAINTILGKHEKVRELADNEWIHLLAMDDSGQVAYRYTENLQWEKV